MHRRHGRDGVLSGRARWVILANPYAVVVPKLAVALEACQTTQVLDLCSGAGGPWATLLPMLQYRKPAVLLTDFYPNPAHTTLPYHPEPVDATAVPATLSGFRTLFASFHHFRPEQAGESHLNRLG